MSSVDDLHDRFPALTPENHQITSPVTDLYNCVAWVRRRLDEWWEPGFCWPDDIDAPDENPDLDAYVELFERWGYARCDDAAYEPAYLKIALYARNGYFHHVAKQMRDETWSSKAGISHDLKHRDLAALEGALELNFATPVVFMRCADDGIDPMTLEQGRLLL